MYNDIAVQLISFIYILVLSLVYFLKRKYNFLESRIYKSLLIMAGITLLLDIGSIWLIDDGNMSKIGCMIITKTYFISLFGWIILFISYVLLNKSTIKYRNMNELLKQSLGARFFLVLIIVLLALMVILPVNYQINPFSYYGMGVNLLYIIATIGTLSMMLVLIFSSKKLSNDKSWSTFIAVVIFAITFLLQWKFLDIKVLGSGIALVTLFIYFTLENPDLKYI